MKHSITLALCCLIYSAQAQKIDTTKFGHPVQILDINWAHSILFSTDNPYGSGHLDWGLHKDTVYMDVVEGGSVMKGGKVVKRFRYPTWKPFIFLDTTDMATYYWEVSRPGGGIALNYDDKAGEFTQLILHLDPDTVLNVYNVVHFW